MALLMIGPPLGIPTLADVLARVIPSAWEETVGARVIAAVADAASFCTNSEGQAALQILTDRLTATLESPPHFTVRVSQSPRVNAFSAPGEQIFLFQGLLLTAQSPEEVAGVLAHEMAHIVERHALRRVLRAVEFRLLSSALVGNLSSLVFSAAWGGKVLTQFSYGRGDELAADQRAMAMLNHANIRGQGFIDALARRWEREKTVFSGLTGSRRTWGQVQALLALHPTAQTRVAALRSQAHGTGDALTTSQWQALRTICGNAQR